MNRRITIPGRFNLNGGQRVDTARYPYPGCSGGCNQGDSRCDCGNELSNVVPLRQEFPTPERTREDDAFRARALRRMLAAALGAWAAFALLLYFASHLGS